MMTIALLLIENLGVTLVCFLILWRIGVARRDVTFVDSYWAFGMVILSWASFIETGPPSARKLMLTGVCTAWGLRLGLHLLSRWRAHGADHRYEEMMAHAQSERGWSFAKASLLLVFALQAPLQFVVCLPVQLGQAEGAGPVGVLGYAGLALALIGLVFETVGDWQLTRFKADPTNRGKVLDTGLWRYTRHPNYFGDACVWWGLYLLAAETAAGLWSIPGPILLTLLLTRWSGVPTVEGGLRKNRPGYEDYVRRTSGFIPWPPKPAAPVA